MWQEKEPWKYTDLTLLQPLGVWHMTSFNPLNWKSEVMDADHTDQPSWPSTQGRVVKNEEQVWMYNPVQFVRSHLA